VNVTPPWAISSSAFQDSSWRISIRPSACPSSASVTSTPSMSANGIVSKNSSMSIHETATGR